MVGINPDKFDQALESEEVRDRMADLDRKYQGVKRIVGVDRLDYIKGLPQKLRGFGQMLKEYPEWRGKIVLIQIVVPSREEVSEYQELKSGLDRLVGEINGNYGKLFYSFPLFYFFFSFLFCRQSPGGGFSTSANHPILVTGRPDYVPIVVVYSSVSFTELTALYAASDICLLTSTRDGMNLVAAEYVACQQERNGVLVLSEFAGASSYLQTSIQFNPLSSHGIAKAIHDAAEMDNQTRKMLHQKLLGFVRSHTRYVACLFSLVLSTTSYPFFFPCRSVC